MRRPRPHVIGLAALVLLGAAPLAEAQSSRTTNTRSSSGSGYGRTTSSSRSASGGGFPTWEREVESDERAPLPWGRPGRYVPAWTHELGGEPRGVAALGPRFVAVAGDGRVRVLDGEGNVTADADAGGTVTLAPRSTGDLVVVAADGRLVGVRESGIAWASAGGARIVREPVLAGRLAYVVREGGGLEAVSLEDGSPAWSASADGEVVAGPSASGSVVVVGVGGEMVAFDVVTGAPAWRQPVGERIDSVLVTDTFAYATGVGRSGRTKDVAPVVSAWPLRGPKAKPQGAAWRLRVGGRCTAEPVLLDDLVGFACADGYVRAISREKGVGGWRTDLPSVTTRAPLPTAGRLDVVIPQSRHVVALQADNGAVLGWLTLPDEDETFVGSGANTAGVTATTTSFGRVIGWRWERDETAEPDENEAWRGPGGRDADPRVQRGNAIRVGP